MLKYLLIGVGVIVVLIVVLLVVVAMQPNEFVVNRTALIAGPPAAVFPHVNNFRNWEPWSPWEKLDPDLKRTYSGAESGVGAKYAWAGDENVGSGHMTITESRPDEFIKLDLVFLEPFAGTCDTEFKFAPQGNDTEMTWTMRGKNNFMGKAMGLMMNMDKMIGESFEKGMANLSAEVKKEQGN